MQFGLCISKTLSVHQASPHTCIENLVYDTSCMQVCGGMHKILSMHQASAHETFYIELVSVHKASPHDRLYIAMYWTGK